LKKHFTIDKMMEGPDQSTSASPGEFARLVTAICNAESVLGSPLKQPCAIAKENMAGIQRSIVAKNDIKKSELLSEYSITFNHPSTGLKPMYFSDLIGIMAAINIAIDEFIQWEDICH
jgi:N,N'-diacetyllegionaminate synthase